MTEAKEYTYTTLNEPITGYKVCVKKSFFDRMTSTKTVHRLWKPTPMDLLLVKVIIPEGATVYTSTRIPSRSGFSSKCRSNRAFVDSIYTIGIEYRDCPTFKCYAEQAYKGYAYSIYFTSLITTRANFNPSYNARMKKSWVNFLENTRNIKSHYKKGDTILIKEYFYKTPTEILDEEKHDKFKIFTDETDYLSFLRAAEFCECASGFHFYKTEEEALEVAGNLLRTGGF